MEKRTFILSLILPLIMVTLPVMIIGMSMCQLLKHSIFPTMTIWESHTATVLFSSILATVAAYFLLRKREALIGQLREEVAERKQSEIRLHDQGELLRDLSARLTEVEESERKRLAAELHDLVGQNLSTLEINLNILGEAMPVDMPQPAHARLQDSLVKVADTIESIRQVIMDLRPSILDDFGLAATIRWYGGEFSQRTGIAMKMHIAEVCPRLPAKTESTLFRIFQEALVNVQKHAHAAAVTVSLKEEDNKVRLLIYDDGVGFDRESTDKAPARKGWGLAIMTERSVAVAGRFSIRSQPGQGTQIAVEVTR